MKRKMITKLAAAYILTSAWLIVGATAAFAGIKTTDVLRVRKNPSLNATIVDLLPKGASVDVIEQYDSMWSKINFKGNTCYVATQYLKDDGNSASAETTQTASVSNVQKAGDVVEVQLNSSWKYADFSVINSGSAKMYYASANRKGKVIGVNAGHGTKGGTNQKTWCHPDKTEKVTGGTTAAGATKAVAVSTGMTFNDGTSEASVTLREAQIVKDILLSKGYDVLMIRDGEDVQLDNVARSVICNNMADCHIAIHWDGDGLDYDKGCFYMSVPDGIKYLESVAATWQSSERLGDCLISGLSSNGCKIRGEGSMDMDLTQTSYSTVPSVDIELGNQCSSHDDATLTKLANGLAKGVDQYFGY